jgi:adenylate cyclase
VAVVDEEHDSEEWRRILIEGHRPMRLARHTFRHLPSAPRCKVCANPFGGFGGRVFALAGYTPSRKNPNLCARCCDSLPPGGAEVDVAILFADVRGSTDLGERTAPRPYAELLNRFYATATDVLLRHDAVIDKLIGDEAMALFIPGVAGPEYRRRAVEAAVDVVREVSPWLRVGAAVNAGTAFVGNVGSAVVDFTALGDPVNVAARLQEHAAAGEVVVADDLAAGHPQAERRELALRGHAAPVAARVIRV